MSSCIERLPFDIVHQIVRRLDIRSHDSLTKTCWTLYRHLQDEGTAKNAVQASLLHCLWAQLALSISPISLRRTLSRINDTYTALQTASPYSVCIIAYAINFSYNLGVLCYTTCSSLRILNFNDRHNTEKVFDCTVFSDQLATTRYGKGQLGLESLKSIQILGYASEIVTLLCHFGMYGQHIFAVNISNDRSSKPPTLGGHPRVLLCAPVRSTNKLFIRHNSTHLVVGSHSAVGSDNHHEWLLEVFDLQTSIPVTKELLQLRQFYGSEIGSTACFTIYKGEFYALTTQTSLESEEVDWTSYYHFIRFRLDDPCPDLRIRVIWRRQHLEGPINDAWNDLGFQEDYSTGELLIVECRKEWINGGSRSQRTYYSQPFDRVEHRELEDGLRHPPDDPLSRTLDEYSNSRWEESLVRADRYVHSEFQGDVPEGTKEYIRARTKWNGYSFNAQSYVDLVIDEVLPEGEWRPRQLIRLRVVSRQEMSPLVMDNVSSSAGTEALVLRPRRRDRDGVEMEDGGRAFTPSRISVWPPTDAPQGLHNLLCPEGRAGDVKAVLGDEGLVYMAGPPRQVGSPERALILVSFDPTFGFVGMKRLDGSFALPKLDRKRKDELEPRPPPPATKKPKSREAADMPFEKSEGGQGKDLGDLAKKLSDSAPGCVENSTSSTSPVLDFDSISPLRTTGPSSSSLASVASPVITDGQDKSKEQGKGKAKAQLLTWREDAAYLSIARGYWLR